MERTGRKLSAVPRSQRCAVRVTYARNTVRGQWRAHGRYIERESAAGESVGRGFDRVDHGIDIAARLESWQAAQDPRLWKIIISPEFGERVDLTRLSRDLMNRIEEEIGLSLEWVAVNHFNTEHPHSHVALRGVGPRGQPFQLDRDLLKHGIRAIAEDLCTRQLGHRTEMDAVEAERREVLQRRFTSLDRVISRDAQLVINGSVSELRLTATSPSGRETESARLRRQHVAARLAILGHMGLARQSAQDTWILHQDFERVLRAMQGTADRQRVLGAHGVIVSDERLPTGVLDLRTTACVEGRVLVHGEEEQSGRGYLMLEGVDARIHFIYYTREMERARALGKLRPNAFARLQRTFTDGELTVKVEDFGDSEAFINNRKRLSAVAQALLKRGILPSEDGWGGWLGRYQSALRQAAIELEYSHSSPGRDRARERGR